MSGEDPHSAAPRRGLGTWLMTGFTALGIVTACGLAGALVLLATGQWDGGRRPALVAAGADNAQSYIVSDIGEIAGTPFEQIVISAGDPAAKAVYSSRSSNGDDRNVILLDRRTGASRKLLPDNTRHIVARHLVPAAPTTPEGDQQSHYVADPDEPPSDKTPPAAFYLLLVRGPDAKTADLIVGALADGTAKTAMQGLDGVDRYWMQDATHLALICREREQLYYRVVDMASLAVVTSRRIVIA